MNKSTKVRHVLGISGGKDSAALAIYLKKKGTIPNIEYYYSDTGCELQETYNFIDKLEVYLGKKIVRIGSEAPFEHHLFMYGNMLPSPRQRWCTKKLKIEPFEKFVGTDEVTTYIGIRADENRDGYISTKPNIKPVFPFIEDGLVKKDIFQILEETVGIPEYYKWRSRSGCYFCFFQKREEWVKLHENHPDLFAKAMALEKYDPITKKRYTWIEGMSLKELLEKKDRILELANKRRQAKDNRTWQQKLIENKQNDNYQNVECLIKNL